MRHLGIVLSLSFVVSVALSQAPTPAGSNVLAGTPTTTGTSEERIYQPKEEGVTAPRIISSRDPEYPSKGRNGLKEGMVVLQMVIGRDGLPHGIAVTRSASPGFDKAAIDAVRKWKFKPATKDGKAVSAQITVQVFIKGIW